MRVLIIASQGIRVVVEILDLFVGLLIKLIVQIGQCWHPGVP